MHVCVRYEVSKIKPVAREDCLQTMTQGQHNQIMDDKNADP